MTNADIKILIVDDEPDIIEFLSYNLKKEGYQVYSAINGHLAIEKAKLINPDLVILDIMMPKMDGIEVCTQLRKIESFAHTSIIFLTAREEDFTQIAALEAGGDDFVIKPIRPRVFNSRVAAMLRRKYRVEENSDMIEIGEFQINRTEMLVIFKNVKYDLPKKEFEILWLLASKPGKVFNREEIFQKIWGNEVIVGNRTIDVHIRKLREKLGDGIIKTIKGTGYKLEL